MKFLIIYDSVFGNTEKVAQAMGAALNGEHQADVLLVSRVSAELLSGAQGLLVGSPTRGFNATPAVMGWLKGLPARALQGKRVAAFDTRIDANDIHSVIGRFFVRTGGYAAPRMAKLLRAAGGELAAPPEGYIVLDREGPLRGGELERAAQWARSLAG